jgi:energy-converting hydrogenase Eha subunit G
MGSLHHGLFKGSQDGADPLHFAGRYAYDFGGFLGGFTRSAIWRSGEFTFLVSTLVSSPVQHLNTPDNLGVGQVAAVSWADLLIASFEAFTTSGLTY